MVSKQSRRMLNKVRLDPWFHGTFSSPEPSNRPIRLTQCCTQFKSPGVKILCVFHLQYNVAFAFKWYGNSWNKTFYSQRVWIGYNIELAELVYLYRTSYFKNTWPKETTSSGEENAHGEVSFPLACRIPCKKNTLMTLTSLPVLVHLLFCNLCFFTNSFITLMLPMVMENKSKYLHFMIEGVYQVNYGTCILKFILGCKAWGNKGDVTRDDSQRRFLEQHSVATLLRRCFEWLQHCSNIATLYCAKNRRCESSRVTSP